MNIPTQSSKTKPYYSGVSAWQGQETGIYDKTVDCKIFKISNTAKFSIYHWLSPLQTKVTHTWAQVHTLTNTMLLCSTFSVEFSKTSFFELALTLCANNSYFNFWLWRKPNLNWGKNHSTNSLPLESGICWWLCPKHQIKETPSKDITQTRTRLTTF